MEYFENCGLDYHEMCPLVPTKKSLQPLTFHPVPPLAQSLKLAPESSNHLIDTPAKNVTYTLMVPDILSY